MSTERVTIEITGLGCGGSGALTVERALARLPGVKRAYVNPATETAYVEYNPTVVRPRALATSIEAAGFRPAEPVRR